MFHSQHKSTSYWISDSQEVWSQMSGTVLQSHTPQYTVMSFPKLKKRTRLSSRVAESTTHELNDAKWPILALHSSLLTIYPSFVPCFCYRSLLGQQTKSRRWGSHLSRQGCPPTSVVPLGRGGPFEKGWMYGMQAHSMRTIYHMGGSKNGGTQKWLIYNGKSHEKWVIQGYPHVRKCPYNIW